MSLDDDYFNKRKKKFIKHSKDIDDILNGLEELEELNNEKYINKNIYNSNKLIKEIYKNVEDDIRKKDLYSKAVLISVIEKSFL